MKKKLMTMTLLAATAAFGEIWTITVPDGETKYLQAEVEALIAEKGHGFAGGDVVEKEGGGRLVGTNTWKSANIGLRVKEGVYEARLLGDLFGGAFVTVFDGASLCVNSRASNGSSICNGKTFFLNGHGHASAAVNGLVGAIVFGENENYEVMNNCTFHLQTDATIAVGVPRQMGMFSRAVINQDHHRLTLRGGGHTLSTTGNVTLYQLRFRYGYGITNAAEIVVDGGAFVAHNVTYWARPNKVPLCTVKNRGAFGPDGQSFADCFARVSFETGTFVAPASGTSVSLTMPPFEGCPFFTARVTPTINKAWTVRANEIASGVALGTYNALTVVSLTPARPTWSPPRACQLQDCRRTRRRPTSRSAGRRN